MVNRKEIPLSFFVSGPLISLFYPLVRMNVAYAPPGITATYAPPGMMTVGHGQDFTLVAVGLAIIFLAGLARFFIGRRRKKSKP
ncbi:hypothetical protein [Methanoregula sp.]|uniref:hypothetical protein n=1 Tax=Methanoregula sp. TaxID=2052170 RepID=UPI003C7148A1